VSITICLCISLYITHLLLTAIGTTHKTSFSTTSEIETRIEDCCHTHPAGPGHSCSVLSLCLCFGIHIHYDRDRRIVLLHRFIIYHCFSLMFVTAEGTRRIILIPTSETRCTHLSYTIGIVAFHNRDAIVFLADRAGCHFVTLGKNDRQHRPTL